MKPAIITSCVVLTAFICFFAIKAQVSSVQSSITKDEGRKAFFAGTMNPLPGPYLSLGDAKNLKFNPIKIAGGKRPSLSESGDLLYRTKNPNYDPASDNPIEWLFFIRRSNGNVQSFPSANYVFMSVNGKALIPSNTDRLSYDPYWDNIYLGQEGYFYKNEGTIGSLHYLDFQLNKKTLELKSNESFIVAASSSGLGDIGLLYKSKHDESQIGLLKNGKVKAEPFPYPTVYCQVAASSNSLAVTSGRHFFERIPYLRNSDGTYTRMRVPNGTVQAQAYALNSKGDYILLTLSPCKHSVKHPGLPYDPTYFLVHGSKAYDFQDIQKQVFGANGPKVPTISHVMLDEQGDLIAEDGDVYLLKRQ